MTTDCYLRKSISKNETEKQIDRAKIYLTTIKLKRMMPYEWKKLEEKRKDE